VLKRLFPEVPPDHPAMGAMIMNIASNMLGLGNAATPFGLKAMVELDKLNPLPGVATNAMALFLAINATALHLMAPTGTAAIRAAAGSQMPLAIWIPTLIATTCSTVTAVTAVLLFQRLRVFAPRPLAGEATRPPPPSDLPEVSLPTESRAAGGSRVAWIAALGLTAVVAIAFIRLVVEQASAGTLGPFLLGQVAAFWLLPLLMFGFVASGLAASTRVYEVAIEGGKEALGVAARIGPYLVMILAAIAMFRASGALGWLIGWIDPVTSQLGVPGEVLPMMLLRPLSGSGAFAVMAEIIQTHGPDSYVGLLVSTLQGSTETTFYVLAVYLGAIGVRNSRHILPACLLGDLAGYAGAVVATRLFFG
jgi:spore maturation protein SpmB